MAQINKDLKKHSALKKYLRDYIIGYSAFWSMIFTTITGITISIMIGVRHTDTIVEVTYGSFKLLSYFIKFMLWL